MPNSSGTLTINGINDAELVKILEIKIKHEKSFAFNPQNLQPVVPAQPQRHVVQQGQQPSGQEQTYNNALFNWQNDDGLEAVREIVVILLKKEENRQEKVAGEP